MAPKGGDSCDDENRAHETGTKSLARRFANALDLDDLEAVRPMLAPECRYETGSDTLVGADAILSSYREASRSARAMLDSIAYESAVIEGNFGSAIVEFVDFLTHAGRKHEYRCRQKLEFRADGMITRIVHTEIPGQRERLEEFLRESGARRAARSSLS